MSRINEVTRYFALVVGIAFVLAGIAGFMPIFTHPMPADAPHMIVDSNYGLLLGLFPVNALHSIFHFCVGVFGIFSFRNYLLSRNFSRFLGVVLGILTIMGILPGFHTTFGMLPLYGHDIWLHGLEAVIGLYLGFFVRHNEQVPA
jgi:hypothetical protein